MHRSPRHAGVSSRSGVRSNRRNRIVLEVRETNLSAQLFFRQLGFRATGVLKGFYEDTPEDAFLMQFRQTADEAMGIGSSKRFAG